MGRPLSSLDSDGGPLVAFAQDLRQLRSRAGEPTLEAMSRRSGLSRTVLSEAMSGKKLPSETVLEGFVRQCDGTDADVAAWLERRRSVQSRLDAPPDSGDAEKMAVPQTTGPSRWRRRTWVGLAMACLAAAAVAGIAGFQLGHQASSDGSAFERAPRTGDDPGRAGCRADAVVGARATEPDGTIVELVWSEKCQANWGRIIRTDNNLAGNGLSVTITGKFANAPNPITAVAFDQQMAHTPLLLTGSEVKACVTGTVTTNGVETALPQPACG